MRPYPPFPSSIEVKLLSALHKRNVDGALKVLRRWNAGWGKADRSAGFFGLAYPLHRLYTLMEAEPPQFARLDDETKNALRVMAAMTQFAGGENYSGSTRWSPGGIEWKDWREPVLLARMCFFWATNCHDHYQAKRFGHRWKRVLVDNPVKANKDTRCKFCQGMRDLGFIGIDAEFEPGVVFPPFASCEHPVHACRCQLEYSPDRL